MKYGEKNPMFGKKHTEDSKNKNSVSVKKARSQKHLCDKCGKNVDFANLKRWHNDRCKSTNPVNI